jgi:hypothetical protein
MSYFRQPSFFTNGKTAAFVGATTEGNFSTVLVDPSSKVSSFEKKLPRTFCLIQQTFPQRKAHNSDSIRHQNIEVFYQRTFRVLLNQNQYE